MFDVCITLEGGGRFAGLVKYIRTIDRCLPSIYVKKEFLANMLQVAGNIRSIPSSIVTAGDTRAFRPKTSA